MLTPIAYLRTGANLIAEVVERGHQTLLDEPFVAFALSSGLVGQAQRALQVAFREDPSVTLRGALEAQTNSFRALVQSHLWPSILVALRNFLYRLSELPGVIPARANVGAPPADAAQFEPWLERTGTLALGNRPALEAMGPWAPPHLILKVPATMTLWALAIGCRPPQLDPKDQDLLVRSARAFLHAKAVNSPTVDALAPLKVEDRPIAHPGLEKLEQRLRKARADLGALDERPRNLAPRFWFGITEEPLALLWEGLQDGSRRFRVSVKLENWRSSLTPVCTCTWYHCSHRKPALDDLIAWMHFPPAPDHARLADLLGRPSWTRQLRELDALEARASRLEAAPEQHLVSWELVTGPHHLSLEARLHKMGKKGTWTAGSRIDLGRMRYLGLEAFPNSGQVLGLLNHTYGRPELRDVAQILELLSGYPFLHLAGLKAPLAVRKGEVTLELSSAEGVLALETRVDGARITLMGRRDDDALGLSNLDAAAGGPVGYHQKNQIVVVDRAASSCTLVPLGPAQAALFQAVELVDGLPAEALPDLVPRLALIERHFALKLPPDLEGERVEADPRHVVRLTPQGEGSLGIEVLVRPMPGSATRTPGEPPHRLTGEREGKRVHVVRDLPGESLRAADLRSELKLPPDLRIKGDAALDLLGALEKRTDVLVEWPQDAKPVRVFGLAQTSALKVAVESKRDWFGLEGAVQVGEEQIALAALLEAVRRGSGYVEVAPGRFAQIAQELRERLLKASEVVFSGRSGLEVSPAGAEALADLLDSAGELKISAGWKNLVGRMKVAMAMEPALPAGLKAELRPYQLQGFQWLMRMAHWGVGVCLADDMGLGKTVEALAALLARRELGPALVIAPTSVGFNWVRECERFTPGLKPVVFREGDRAATLKALAPGDLLVCSYGLLLRHAEELKAVRFATLVLDEAQAIKNAATQRARAARDLDAEWRIGLTGTPMENHLGELWSLFRVLTPGLLGSWEQFRARFAQPIEKLKDPVRRQALARVVRPFILRRTKAQVAPELPPRTELRRQVSLSAAERKLYEEARLAAIAKLTGVVETGEDKRFAALAALTKLRQIACHPKLCDPESKIPSSKLKELMALVAELRDEGHRALVFSQFTSHLALVRDALDEEGVKHLYLDGQTPEHERRKRVDAFQGGEGELFLISLKAGGTGLNLTGADYVIHLDPWWNPAVEDQASDRAHRIGQTKPVTVYRLVTTGTIEEAILSLHEEKRDLVAGVLGGSGAAAKLSTEELLALIHGGEDAPEIEPDDAGDAIEVAQAAEVEDREPSNDENLLENAGQEPRADPEPPPEPVDSSAPRKPGRPSKNRAPAPSTPKEVMEVLAARLSADAARALSKRDGESRTPRKTEAAPVAPVARVERPVGPKAAPDWVEAFGAFLTENTGLKTSSVGVYRSTFARFLEASQERLGASFTHDLLLAAAAEKLAEPSVDQSFKATASHLRRWLSPPQAS